MKNIPNQHFPVCSSQIAITHFQFAESIRWKPVDMVSCCRTTHCITIWCFRYVEEGRRRIRRICRSRGPRTSTPTLPSSQKPMSKSPKPTWTMPLTAPLFSTVLHEQKTRKFFSLFILYWQMILSNFLSPLNSSPVHQIKYQGQLVNGQELNRQASTSKCSNQYLKHRSFTIRRSSRDPRTKNTGSSTVAHMYRTNAVPFHGSRQ